jgi:hypothetical protein
VPIPFVWVLFLCSFFPRGKWVWFQRDFWGYWLTMLVEIWNLLKVNPHGIKMLNIIYWVWSSALFLATSRQILILKLMISTNTKDFPWKQWLKFSKFLKKKVFKSPVFYVKFQ